MTDDIGERYFEGSLVLEKLAEADRVKEFFEAVDSENSGS